MMSARPRREISSRTAGVSAVGTRPPYHRRARNGVGGAPPWTSVGRPEVSARRSEPRFSAWQIRDGPVGVRRAGRVAAVRALEGEPLEPERAPRPDPGVDRRADVDPAPDEPRFVDDRLQDPLALEERDVEERLVVEPEEVDDDEGDVLVGGRRLALDALHGRRRLRARAPAGERPEPHLADRGAGRFGELALGDLGDALDGLVGQIAVDEQPGCAAGRRQFLRDRPVVVVDRVAVEIADRDRAVVDESQDAEAGPERLDDRIADLVRTASAELLGPPLGGRCAGVDCPHGLLGRAHAEIVQRVRPRAAQRPADRASPHRGIYDRRRDGAEPPGDTATTPRRARGADPERPRDRPARLGALRLRQHDLQLRGRVAGDRAVAPRRRPVRRAGRQPGVQPRDRRERRAQRDRLADPRRIQRSGRRTAPAVPAVLHAALHRPDGAHRLQPGRSSACSCSSSRTSPTRPRSSTTTRRSGR